MKKTGRGTPKRKRLSAYQRLITRRGSKLVLQFPLEVLKGIFRFLDTPSEIVRLKADHLPTVTGKFVVRLYPSDAFLRFTAALRAWNRNLGIVK
ncbi:MAG: hypothetical protein ABR964_06000 [Tepidisphaeraceae bacterium]